METTITIHGRFNGPPDSGNGGYVCGVVAVASGIELIKEGLKTWRRHGTSV